MNKHEKDIVFRLAHKIKNTWEKINKKHLV